MRILYNNYQIVGLLFLLFSCIYGTQHDLLWLLEEKTDTINEITQEVLYRYYIIARLQTTVQHLQYIAQHDILDYDSIRHIPKIFTNTHIIATIDAIQETYSLDSFWKLWNNIASYKHLHDTTFDEEFLRLLAFIMFHVVHGFKEKREYSLENINSILHSKGSLKETSYTDISYRFYIIKRLHVAFAMLEKYKNIPLKITIDTTAFSDTRVIACIHTLIQEQKMVSFLELCKHFEQFRHCNDMRFTHEFLMLTLTIYKHIYTMVAGSETYPHEFMPISVQDDVSIETILQSIDTLARDLPTPPQSFIKKHPGISWFCRLPIYIFIGSLLAYTCKTMLLQGLSV